VVDNADFTIVNAPLGPFPAARVPTSRTRFHMAGYRRQPFNFEVSPFPADHTEDLAFEGDPDREAGPVAPQPVGPRCPTRSWRPQTWLALPTIGNGPFGEAVPARLQHALHRDRAHAAVRSRPVTSATVDPLLAYVSADAPRGDAGDGRT
jgi:hypothetical protein